MSFGGAVTVLYTGPASATATITGPGAFTITGAGAATFPSALTTAKTQFVTPTSGTYTVTVNALGLTIASYTIILDNGAELVFDATPNFATLFSSIQPTVSTTAALAAVGNAINTAGKYTGKVVWNSTTSKPVWANGPLTTDTWKDATGTLAHTPV